MQQLIDTNALIFFLEGHSRLRDEVAERIEDPRNKSLVSICCLWEISIKAAIGKLQVDYADREDLPELLSAMGFTILPLTWSAICRAGELEFHHRDPFDRILIAEAQLRDIPVISADSQFDAYGVERIW